VQLKARLEELAHLLRQVLLLQRVDEKQLCDEVKEDQRARASAESHMLSTGLSLEASAHRTLDVEDFVAGCCLHIDTFRLDELSFGCIEIFTNGFVNLGCETFWNAVGL